MALVVAQFALLVLVFHQYELERAPARLMLLQISRWDYHPDDFGNELLAERLYQQLEQSEAFLALLGDD
jgi:hypothetical protein